MDILHRFMAQLDLAGISYAAQENSVQLILCSGSHKWKCAVTAPVADRLCIFSRYPWSVREECQDRLLRELNSLNSELAEGCFILDKDQVILRYSVFVPDPLISAQTAWQQFTEAASLTEWAWNRIFSVLHSPEDQ